MGNVGAGDGNERSPLLGDKILNYLEQCKWIWLGPMESNQENENSVYQRNVANFGVIKKLSPRSSSSNIELFSLKSQNLI